MKRFDVRHIEGDRTRVESEHQVTILKDKLGVREAIARAKEYEPEVSR